jgi:hypothetical protein
MEVIAGELSSAAVEPLEGISAHSLLEEVRYVPGVRKAIFLDSRIVFIEDEEYAADITQDFDELEGQMLYEGSYPRSANEAAISGAAALRLGKSIGDSVEVSQGSDVAEYVITGFLQSGNYAGKQLALTEDGILRIMTDFAPSFIYVYLDEGEPASVFVESLKSS